MRMGCYPGVQPSPISWCPPVMRGDCNQLSVHNRYQRLKKKIKKNLKNVLLDSVAQAARGMLLLDLGGFHDKQLKFPECQQHPGTAQSEAALSLLKVFCTSRQFVGWSPNPREPPRGGKAEIRLGPLKSCHALLLPPGQWEGRLGNGS